MDAIDKLLSSFDSQTLQCSFLAAKVFKEIKSNLESLKSLKNDYHFRQSIDIKVIDKWLAEIEDKAFSILSIVCRKWLENKKKKEKIFLFLIEEVNLFVINLIHDHQNNLLAKMKILQSPLST